MDNVNIKQLAKALNLSTSTVSRAFRDNSDISKETKERILTMAKELNYQPNHHASNLREQRSRTIAVIVPEMANNFFSQAIHGIERVAREKGYHILIYATDDDYQKEVSFIRHLHNGRADGIIMSVSGEANDHNYLNELTQKRLPLVFFDRVYEDIITPRVITNDYDSSFSATQHLIKQGCTRIAYLVINKNLSIGKFRMQGYIDALVKYKIPYDEDLIIDCTNSYPKNNVILKKVLTQLKPDGVFTSVERLAFATYYACYDLKISVPEELKVIGFSSLEIAPLLNPSLTTVTQPATKIGVEAALLLFKMLEDPSSVNPNEKIVLNSKLIKRRSTEI
ncbi:LacI family DNA-binding transcriptional regulator [Pedobacter panaciterrae]|jgi:Transcriptional regulators|uniref:LacI family DNA-binding transcriptional regulator n=1 Tax=Pedobacter panaciterrae TaxID=363849 RepID=A0ABU8NS62_9SPHI|nr:LacI family DNA-binding transcriptional regulator [Pedobacter panaciterrae]NQX54738.1 LacI family DNA-binding transcriptional regulator [Pedobacter panaciterrae]